MRHSSQALHSSAATLARKRLGAANLFAPNLRDVQLMQQSPQQLQITIPRDLRLSATWTSPSCAHISNISIASCLVSCRPEPRSMA